MDDAPAFEQSRLGRLSAPACRVLLLAIVLGGIACHAAYLWLSPALGLSGDEAHYWDWSRQLDISYYSKGPAVAAIIRAGCLVFGDTQFGVRWPALILAGLSVLSTYWLTRRIFKGHAIALLAVVICHLVPMFVAGSMLMTIDPPYYLCWGMATLFGYLAAIEGRRWAWPAAGAAIGLGFLAKYASLLWLVCLLIYLIAFRPARWWLKTVWPYVAIVTAMLFTVPVLIWNHHHGWVSFGHVARSTSENQSHFNPLQILANAGELVATQIGLLNPVIAGLMVAAVVRAVRRLSDGSETMPSRREGLAYLLATSVPFFGFVLVVTLFKNAEPNWPVATYFSLVPLTAWFIAETWRACRGWFVGAAVVGVAAGVALHFSAAVYPLINASPKKWDPSWRLRGGPQIGAEVSKVLAAMPPGTFVLCDRYQATSLAAFYVTGQPKTYCIGAYITDPQERDRLSQFNIWPDRDLSQPALRGRDAVFVGYAPDDLKRAFERVEPVPDLPITYNGRELRRQRLFRCYGFKGMRLPDDGLTKR